jgi:hypothetical protein
MQNLTPQSRKEKLQLTLLQDPRKIQQRETRPPLGSTRGKSGSTKRISLNFELSHGSNFVYLRVSGDLLLLRYCRLRNRLLNEGWVRAPQGAAYQTGRVLN